MKKIYTRKNWSEDTYFNAKVGQRIEQEIFWNMLDSIQPRIYTTFTIFDYKNNSENITKIDYFLMGEIYDHNGKDYKPRYMLFICKNNEYYYYGGLTEVNKSKIQKRILNIMKGKYK